MISIALGMVVGLLVLLALGMPIAFALIVVGVGSLLVSQGWGAASYLLGNFPYSASSDFSFIIIPLFLFMGQMAFLAGTSSRAFRAARAWIGHLPGGLPIAAVTACAGFAAVCGSSIVTAVTIGRIAIPEMLKAGVSQRLAGGAVATAGTLGVLIPPSGILVVYSIATQVRILDLFICAVVPGLVTVLFYIVGIYTWVKVDPRERSATLLKRASWAERYSSLLSSWEIALLFGVVIGSMYLGIATPTEAAAVGAIVATAIALARCRSMREIRGGLIDSGTTTSAIFALIIGAGIFSLAFATTQVPQQLASFVAAMDVHPVVLLIVLLIPYLFLGMFLDAISMILLTMPLVFPIVIQNDINPVLFGILVTKMTEIGNITPPVGLNVYVLKGISKDIEISEIFRGVGPFILMETLVIALFIAFPSIVLFPLSGN